MKAAAVHYVVKSAATLADMSRIVARALLEGKYIAECKQALETLRQSDA